MTGQINDNFNYSGKNYSLSSVEYPDLFFNIEDLGFKTFSDCTACWRGYTAGFAINKADLLVLRDLSVNHSVKAPKDGSAPKAPLINKKRPTGNDSYGQGPEGYDDYEDEDEDEDEAPSFYSFHLSYKKVDLPLNYTGGIIITRGFIRSRYVHQGFQSPTSYEEVIELRFENGVFTGAKDLSGFAEAIRAEERAQYVRGVEEHFAKRASKDDVENHKETDDPDFAANLRFLNLPLWVARQYDMSYHRIGLETDYEYPDAPQPESAFETEIKKGKCRIIEYQGGDEHVIIPDSIDGAPVVALDSLTFFLNKTLKSIAIHSETTYIGDGAFRNCKSLTEIIIPEKVKAIGEEAFYGCSGLVHISIPKSVTSIRDKAFNACENLAKVDIYMDKSKIDYITYDAFPEKTLVEFH